MTLDRTAPHDTETEQSILSALLIDNAGFDDLGGLSPEDFYTFAHQTIFKSMLRLTAKGQAVDLVTVASHLKSAGQLEKIGGATYLSTIADAAPVALNVKEYARATRNLAAVRKMIRAGMRVVDLAQKATNVEEYISQAQAEILAVQTTDSQDKVFDMQTLMSDALDRIEDAQTRGTDVGMSMGLPTLDPLLQIFGSKLIIVAGRPGMGKTALALSMAARRARAGTKVGFLSIEMDKESLSDRLLGHAANVNSLLFYSTGSLGASSRRDITDAAGDLADLPLYVDDADCTAQDVERKCRKFKKMGCEMIFIDQLSKIRGRAGQSKFEQYSDNCSSIALLKKELRIPIVLLCQLNRNVEQRQDKRPGLADLKQTGMIEEDADIVFLLYRPGYYDETSDQGLSEIILAKNRQGARGVEQQVLFNAKRMMFELSF